MTSNDFDNIKFKIFSGSKNFRLRITYSLLTLTPIEIRKIREEQVNLGLSKYEISFLKLIEQITNGSKVFISQTGTMMKFVPGTITNNYGKDIEVACDSSRALSYYIEGLVPICIFGKEKLSCKLFGVSNNNTDLSLDCFKASLDSLLEKIVVGDTFNIEIVKRSFFPDSSGEIKLNLPIVRFIDPLNLCNIGKVSKIRGHYLSVNTNNLHSSVIDQSRIIFNKLINDVWIDKNSYNNKQQTSGFGLSLWGITTTNCIYSYDYNCFEKNSLINQDDLTNLVSTKMLSEVMEGSAVDSHFQGLVLTLMSLTQKTKVSKLKLKTITDYSKNILKEIKSLFEVKFHIAKESTCDEGYYIFSCLGCQMDNKNRVEGI